MTGRQREDVLAEGLAAVRAIENKWWRARVLAALAPQLREGQREEVLTEGLAAARAIWNERWRAHALAALAPQLAGALRGEVLAEGLAAAQAIEYEKPRAEALAALAPQLTGKLLSEGLAAAQAIGDEEDRACALAALAPQLGTLPFTAFYPLWRETLHYSATRSRRDLLSDLGALVSVIAALGGEEAVAETARAIQDVGRWWP